MLSELSKEKEKKKKRSVCGTYCRRNADTRVGKTTWIMYEFR